MEIYIWKVSTKKQTFCEPSKQSSDIKTIKNGSKLLHSFTSLQIAVKLHLRKCLKRSLRFHQGELLVALVLCVCMCVRYFCVHSLFVFEIIPIIISACCAYWRLGQQQKISTHSFIEPVWGWCSKCASFS